MKINKIIQFSLVIVGIILIFFTYYYNDKDKIVGIDKNILGGIKIRIGNKIIDGSISTKLNKIKRALTST